MKVTSFEISKKLKELGFEAETIFYYNTDNLKYGIEPEQACIAIGDYHTSKHLKAYDLETIIDALPTNITYNTSYVETYAELIIKKDQIYYSSDVTFVVEYGEDKQENECLADTAARLLIQLYEAGLVKFKEE